MQKIIDNWKWEIDDPGLLSSWFSNFEGTLKENKIKSNSQRDVFTICYNDRRYFVKYSHPTSCFQKLRSLYSPKLLSEYNSSKLLELNNIATAAVVGIGQSGYKSMLITESIDDSVDGRIFWFSRCVVNKKYIEGAVTADSIQKTRGVFLAKFANFLKHFFDSNLYHPDFHLGNLMVTVQDKSPFDTLSFTMIDTYGIEKLDSISDFKKFQMISIIGSLRGELTDEEGGALVRSVLPNLTAIEANKKWLDIVLYETTKTVKLWKKRKGRILSDMRYSQLFTERDFSVRIRKDFTFDLQISKDVAVELFDDYVKGAMSSNEFSIIEVDASDAESKWLISFELEFHRLEQQLPIAWFSTDSNSCYFLFRENI